MVGVHFRRVNDEPRLAVWIAASLAAAFAHRFALRAAERNGQDTGSSCYEQLGFVFDQTYVRRLLRRLERSDTSAGRVQHDNPLFREIEIPP